MELTLTGASTLSDNRISGSGDNAISPLHSSPTRNATSNARGLVAANASAAAAPTHSHDHGNHGAHHSHTGHASSSIISSTHTHSHHHSHKGSACCATPKQKIDASTLLPSPQQVHRFKTDQFYRLNVLANVVRGGTFEIFMNLVGILVLEGTSGTLKNTGNDASGEDGGSGSLELKVDDPVAFASLLDGYGADGHTLAHWCAKRGESYLLI